MIQDSVVVITGASAGIGAELAKVVGERGGKPVLAARREPELRAVAAQAGEHALAVVADVTKRADAGRLLDAAIARFGRVDVWVNNAGRGIARSVLELTDEDVDEMILVNVKSVLYCAQAVVPHWKARGAGHLINVSSLLGRLPYVPMRSAYTAAKHALNALTASLRMDLRAQFPGIHVSSVHPGVVATDFGLNVRHGGPDSRAFPGAQPAREVAEVIAGVIESPRADTYTRPAYQADVVAYYAAEDMGAFEAQRFGAPRPRPPST
jgi:NADP-dependent 3-hydroxy acid dehydrogenase YdfG